jgi:hypothetical protein
MNEQTIITLLILSGASHIIMSLGSLAVPNLLDWKKPLDSAPPLLRQVFWTYSAYIKMVNIFFGVVAIFGAHELVGSSFLAKSLNIFIVVYWLGRLGVEFFYYDRSSLKGFAKIADMILVVLFVFFILIHTAAVVHSIDLSSQN